MVKRRRARRQRGAWGWIVWQLLILAAFIGLTLANEIVDVPHALFGDPQTPYRRSEVVIEIALAVSVVALELGFIARLRRSVRILEGFIPICASCKKIRHFDRWEPLERYLLENSMAQLTHGICDECERRLYPELSEDDP